MTNRTSREIMKYILGVDIGTTAIKAVVMDEKGNNKGSYTCEYTLKAPTSGWLELEAEVYVSAFKEAIGKATYDAKIPVDDIASLGISGQGETLLFLDDNNNPIRPAIVWMDNRAVKEAKDIEGFFGRDTVHKTTGQVGMDAIWPASKILWIKRNEPDTFAKTAKYLLIKDYFIFLLTGRYLCEDSLLCSTMLWDINTREYWQEMLKYLGITEEQLPEICRPGSKAGRITKEGAEAFGLNQDMVISVGALDQACGAIGVGNVRPGIFSESTGAALASVTISDKLIFDPEKEIPCFASALPGKYMIHAFSTGGMVMRWYRDVFCSEEIQEEEEGGRKAYDNIDKGVEQIDAGSEGLIMLPHLQGSGPPDSNDEAKGVFFGVTLTHKKPHFARAIMEGVTMVLLRMIEATEALGVEVKEIRSLSGGAKSGVWCQIKSDASRLPLYTMKDNENAACIGAAIMAGVAVGIWTSVEETADIIVEKGEKYMPNPDNESVYKKLFVEYKNLQTGMKGFYKKGD